MARVQRKTTPAKTTAKKTEPVKKLEESSFFTQLDDTVTDVLKAGKNTIGIVSDVMEASREAMKPVLQELRADTLMSELDEVQRLYDAGYTEDEAVAYVTTGRRLVVA